MKRKRNKVGAASLAAIMAFAMNAVPTVATVVTPAAPKGEDIIVLYTNDIHCGINEEGSIGMAGLAAYKADMMAAYGKEHVTLVDCGDAIQGSAIGTLSKGEYMVEMMNAVGYDYAVFGNHEFDYTIPQLSYLVENADATYISCNFKYMKPEVAVIKEEEQNKPLEVAPYAIHDYDGTKVAFVGICTPESLYKSTPAYFMDDKGNYLYTFCQGDGTQLYEAVQQSVDRAREEGATYVVALAHLGIEEASAPYRSTDVIAHTSGIDVMLDGHSHSLVAGDKVKDLKGKEVLLSQAGTKLGAIGKLVIKKDGTLSTELIADYTKKDETTSTYIQTIEEELAAVLNQVVARSEVVLSVEDAAGMRAVRNRETTIGNLCADAYRQVSGADIAFVNGGGIRATINKGDITYKDIINVHPYGNELCVVEATGQEILDALELGCKNTMAETSDGTNAVGESGGFLQVSGLKYSIDPRIPSGVVTDKEGLFVKVEGDRRVQDVQVFNRKSGQYEALKPSKTYTLASHNYMLLSKGDGYSMFADNKLLQDCVMLDNQVLINYITKALNGVIGIDYANTQGRITVKEAVATAKKAA